MQIAGFWGKKTADELYPPHVKKFFVLGKRLLWVSPLDFSEERNNVERYQLFTRIKSFISYEIHQFAGIFDSVISIPQQQATKFTQDN